MLTRISKLSFLFVLAIAFLVVSCDKEGIDELSDNFTATAESRGDGEDSQNAFGPQGRQGARDGQGERGERGGQGERGRQECFDLVYPITLAFSDGSTIEITDEDSTRSAIRAFREANPDVEGRPALVFPVQIDQDGTITDIADEEALEAVVEACPRGGGRGDRGGRGKGRRCFQPVFPVTIEFPDGSSTEVADREAAREAIATYKEANPDAEGRPSIAFPYDVQLRDSSIVTVASAEDLEALAESCGGRDRGPRGDGMGMRCFQVNFPIEVTVDGGDAITINGRSDVRAAIAAWKEANPNAMERPDVTVVFPITVTLDDETTMMINSEEELEALEESCDDDGDEG